MTTRNLSRRTVIAGAAVLGTTTAISATAQCADGPPVPNAGAPDPTFALIETHRSAYIKQLESGRGQFHMDGTPWYAVAKAVWDADWHVSVAASFALAETVPTTVAGMAALLDYVEFFNSGGLALEPWPDATRDDWASSPECWPCYDDDGGVFLEGNGASFAWALLRNVAKFIDAQSTFTPYVSQPGGSAVLS
jgi:hypothetical protein